MSTSISQRDRKTNQVTSHDKSGRVSDAENYALVAKNADAALREFMGPRADDAVAKQAMFKDIQTYGVVKMKDLPYDIENKFSQIIICYFKLLISVITIFIVITKKTF